VEHVAHVRNLKFIQHFGHKSLKEETTCETYLDTDGRII